MWELGYEGESCLFKKHLPQLPNLVKLRSAIRFIPSNIKDETLD